jgi:osmotically-inducible protein OsmY
VNNLAETLARAQPNGRRDDDVLADIGDRLWQDKTTRDSERSALAIEVRDGEVFLAGHVTSLRYRGRVVELIRGIRGVRGICNNLVADPELVGEVVQALAADARTRPAVIRVGAFHGWVHLAGEVPDQATRRAAEELAAGVACVRGVLALPHLPIGESAGAELRRPLQPRVGQGVHAADGPAGRVECVVLDPRSRLASHVVVAGDLVIDGRSVPGTRVVPIAAVARANEGGVFLVEPLSTLAERPAYRAADFQRPPLAWQLPFPYVAGDVRWLPQPASTPVAVSAPAFYAVSAPWARGVAVADVAD